MKKHGQEKIYTNDYPPWNQALKITQYPQDSTLSTVTTYTTD